MPKKSKGRVIGPVMAERSMRRIVCAWCGAHGVGIARDGANQRYYTCGAKGHGKP
jgi:hypothetical protein